MNADTNEYRVKYICSSCGDETEWVECYDEFSYDYGEERGVHRSEWIGSACCWETVIATYPEGDEVEIDMFNRNEYEEGMKLPF